MLSTVAEILRRVLDGHPVVTDLKPPLLLGAKGLLLIALLVGLSAQTLSMRRAKARR